MSKSLKIGVVCYPTFGGSGIVATELGKAFADKGHQVHFITYSKPVRMDLFTENMFFHEVSVLDYPLFEYAPYELLLSSKIVDVAISEQLDLMHVHYAIPHASAAYSAKQILKTKAIKLPYITTLHGTDITLLGKDKSYKPVIEFAINQSDAVTAVSHSLKQDTFSFFNIDNDIQVIPNFIDFNLYNNNSTDSLDRSDFAKSDEKIICHISNFRKLKRVDDVIRIFKGIQDKISSKLVLVGQGPEEDKVTALVNDLGLNDRVLHLGNFNRIDQITAISDLFLLPSETESFGLAALEAMASAVPVISSNVGGLSEVNIKAKTGFLRPVGDIDGMVKDSLYILQNDSTLNSFKENALKHAKTYSLNDILPLYERLYRSII
ncbi:MAG: N-acetyl-alpha-D-glucosaminyl L-malate synthase BshA [Flavobacteriales bacterium]